MNIFFFLLLKCPQFSDNPPDPHGIRRDRAVVFEDRNQLHDNDIAEDEPRSDRAGDPGEIGRFVVVAEQPDPDLKAAGDRHDDNLGKFVEPAAPHLRGAEIVPDVCLDDACDKICGGEPDHDRDHDDILHASVSSPVSAAAGSAAVSSAASIRPACISDAAEDCAETPDCSARIIS